MWLNVENLGSEFKIPAQGPISEVLGFRLVVWFRAISPCTISISTCT